MFAGSPFWVDWNPISSYVCYVYLMIQLGLMLCEISIVISATQGDVQ